MNRDHLNPRPRIRIRQVVPTEGSVSPGDHIVADPYVSEQPRKKRHANRTSWRAGQSGNPRGRPPEAKGLKATSRKILIEKVEVAPGKKMPLFEALLRQEAQQAAKGDWRARATMFNIARWAIGNEPEAEALRKADPEMSDTGRAILAWFADEVLEEERHKRGEGGEAAPR